MSEVRTIEECLKLEQKRLWKWRKSRQGGFESSTLSLDYETEVDAESWLSDGGAGADQIVAHCDREFTLSYYKRKSKEAESAFRNRPKQQQTVRLIIDNGSDREMSIAHMTLKKAPRHGKGPLAVKIDLAELKRTKQWHASEVRYWDHLKKFSNFFKPQ